MTYSGLSYLLPTLLSFVACIAWIYVLSRMSNLKIRSPYRYLALTWVGLSMVLPLMDLGRDHVFDSTGQAYGTIFVKCVLRVCYALGGLWIYKLLAMAYPVRVALSPKESSAALETTETFMASDGSELHKALGDATPDAKLAAAKVQTKQVAVAVKAVSEVKNIAAQAESDLHKAVELVKSADDAAQDSVRAPVKAP